MTKEMYENQMALEAKWEREYDAIVNEQENIPEDYSDVKVTINKKLNVTIKVEDLECTFSLEKGYNNLVDFQTIMGILVVDRDLKLTYV